MLSAHEYAVTQKQGRTEPRETDSILGSAMEDIRTGVLPEYDWYGNTLKKWSFQTQQNLSSEWRLGGHSLFSFGWATWIRRNVRPH